MEFKERKDNTNGIPHIFCAVVTHGNKMDEKERAFRLQQFEEELEKGWIDADLIPYLKEINSFPFLITTQSCCGHGEDYLGRRAHFDFRSMLSEADTINKIIRPFHEKRNPPDVGIEIMVEPYGIRYIVWMRNDVWRDQITDFIETLKATSLKGA